MRFLLLLFQQKSIREQQSQAIAKAVEIAITRRASNRSLVTEK